MIIDRNVLEQWQPRLRTVGVIALAIMVGLCTVAPRSFFYGYLAAYLFWLQLPLGAVGLLLLHALTGGRWGTHLRGPLLLLTLTAVMFVPLFLPIAGGVRQLYSWTATAQGEPGGRAAYLNLPFFFGRVGLYLLLWALGAWLIGRRTGGRGGGTEDRGIGGSLASIGLILYVLTVSFAAIDWVGTLDTHWYSSIFGLYLLIGQVIAAMAAAILLGLMTSGGKGSPLEAPDALHDLGTLLFAFISLHAYFAFSQFFIIWNGNLPHEINWYIPRMRGAWGLASACLMFVHFGLPFALLLSRANKRNPRRMTRIVLLVLAMRVLECIWMVVPSADGGQVVAVAAALTSAVGIGSLWSRFLMRLMRRRWLIGAASVAVG